MIKYLKGFGLTVVLVALIFGSVGVALAGEGQPPVTKAGTRWGGGEIIAIGADNFTVHNRRGKDEVVYVNAQTQLTDADLNPITLADLKVGQRALGAARQASDGRWYALVVHVFPQRQHYKGAGAITNVEEDEFAFINQRGKEWEFYIDADTQITNGKGETVSYSDLKAGRLAFVEAELREDGKWWATVIKVRRGR